MNHEQHGVVSFCFPGELLDLISYNRVVALAKTSIVFDLINRGVISTEYGAFILGIEHSELYESLKKAGLIKLNEKEE